MKKKQERPTLGGFETGVRQGEKKKKKRGLMSLFLSLAVKSPLTHMRHSSP
jgi:hypothetical protein